jgi:hypothetical protein
MVDDLKSKALREEKAGRVHAPSAVGMAALRGLKAGWHDGQGHPIGPTALQAAEILMTARPLFTEAYRLYPTEEGGVLIEFETRGWDLSVEIDASGAVQFYGVEIARGAEIAPRPFDGVSEQFLSVFDEVAGR